MNSPKEFILDVIDIVPLNKTKENNRFFAIYLTPPPWNKWHSGQFVMLKPQSFGMENILARPFCISNLTNDSLFCFIEVKGQGTKKISSLKKGDKVLAWGPLGNAFSIKDRPTLLLAGGMGIAPFIGYALNHPDPKNVSLLFGHREDIKSYPIKMIKKHIKTDCFQEKSLKDREEFISIIKNKMQDLGQNGLVLSCGPKPFLKTIQTFAKTLNIYTELSLENAMACGIGACLGCVCKTTNHKPIQICTNGPVFSANDILLED